MAKKPTISNISSGYASTTTLNSNFTALRDGFDNTLSLDGSTPNSMNADFDVNGYRILNAGQIDTDALYLGGVAITSSADVEFQTTYLTASYTGDGSTVAYSLTANPQSEANVSIYVDGVYQNKTTFSLSGTTVTFSEAPPLNSAIEIVYPTNTDTLNGSVASAITYNQGGTGAQDRTLTSRLQDFVSVKDFGAVGDGVTDDTAAIRTAITNHRHVFIPAGDYRITSTIFLPTYVGQWQDDPKNYIVEGVGSLSRFLIDGGVIAFSGPQNTAASDTDTSEGWTFRDIAFDTYNADKATYPDPYDTLPSFGTAFNLSKLIRSEFHGIYFTYVKGFIQSNTGLDSVGSYCQQILIQDCVSTHHQEYFIDADQCYAFYILHNKIERGNRGIKFARSNYYSAYNLVIRHNVIEANGLSSPVEINPVYSAIISDNYFEANRANSGEAATHVKVNFETGVPSYSLEINNNFFSNRESNISAIGGTYYNINTGALDKDFHAHGNYANGGTLFRITNEGSDPIEIHLTNTSLVPFGTAGFVEEYVVNSGPMHTTANGVQEWQNFDVVIADAATGGNVATVSSREGKIKVRDGVMDIYASASNINTTGMTAGNFVYIRGFPYSGNTDVQSYGDCVAEQITFAGIITPEVSTANPSAISLKTSQSGSNDYNVLVSDLTSGSADIKVRIKVEL
jgi:hypothetical protein